jgi:hypothetical protein
MLEFPRVCEPPRVDNEDNPAKAQRDDHDLDNTHGWTECDDGQRGLRQDQCQQSSEQCKEPEACPDS